MSKKEEQAYDYSKRVSRGNPMTKVVSCMAFRASESACPRS